MTIILLLIMKINNTGVLLHEIFGIVVFLLFVLHKYYNFKWISAVTKLLLNKKANIKTKFMYYLDLILLIVFILIMITGILISESLFPYLNIDGTEAMSTLHHFASYVGLILVAVHIGLHWAPMLSKLETRLGIPKMSELKNFAYGIFTATLSLLGLSATLKQPFYTNMTAPFIKPAVSEEASNIKIETNISETMMDKPTLEEYLGNKICTGCSRRCSLDAIMCSRGTEYVNEATNAYNEKYNENASISEDTTLFDYIYFMGFIVMGTHYIIKIKRDKTKKL